MNEIIKQLDHWQTLIGAFLGGLLVALLVAYEARRREEISAAMLLVGDLVGVSAAQSSLVELAEKVSIVDDDLAPWMAERLVWSRPKISLMYEASMVRVMPLCPELSAHLSLFHTLYIGVEHHLNRLEVDFEEFRRTGKITRSKESINADARLAMNSFVAAAEHAKCAEHLLTHLVLGHFPTWHRVRRTLCPSKEEQKCKERLKKGSTAH